MITFPRLTLDIQKIANSGQCFRMQELELKKIHKDSTHKNQNTKALKELASKDIVTPKKEFLVISGDNSIYVYQDKKDCYLDCTKKEYDAYWKNYFNMDFDYEKIAERISPEDSYLLKAAKASKGLRVLKQDSWETIICFIISQRKSIPAITSCIEKLCEKTGRVIECNKKSSVAQSDSTHENSKANNKWAFPSPEELASFSKRDFKECSVGYRDEYLLDAARKIASKELNLDIMHTLSDTELYSSLLTIKGVGKKVALCIMLYGFHRLNSFPVDVWMQRVLEEQYNHSFPFDFYEGCSGVLQLWLFNYIRSEKISLKGL